MQRSVSWLLAGFTAATVVGVLRLQQDVSVAGTQVTRRMEILTQATAGLEGLTQARLSGLNERTRVLEDQFAYLGTTQDGLDARIAELEGRIQTNWGDLGALKSRVLGRPLPPGSQEPQ